MADEITLHLNHPLTKEDWAYITDENMEYTPSITFTTPNGKQHEYVKVVRCEKCFYAIPYNERWTRPKINNYMWCKRNEDARPLDWFCADGDRRTNDGNN